MSRRTVRTPFNAFAWRGSRGPHSCDRPRCLLGELAKRADLRGRGPPDADALCRRQPTDQTSSGASGHSRRFVDARPWRGGRSSGSGKRDGRTRGEARSRSDRAEEAQRADGGPGKAHSIFQPSPHSLPPGGSAPVWLGPAESKARPVSGWALARRNGRGCRHTREPAGTVQGQRAAWPRRFGRCSHGDDRYWHGDLHHSDPNRGGNARPAA